VLGVVVKPGELRILIAHYRDQLVLIRSAPRPVRQLEPAVLSRFVAIGVQREEDVGEVPRWDRRRNDVDEVATRRELCLDPLRDVHVDIDFVDACPARPSLERDARSELGRNLVGHPVADLDPDASLPGRHRWFRNAHGTSLDDRTARRCERDGWNTRNVAGGIEVLGSMSCSIGSGAPGLTATPPPAGCAPGPLGIPGTVPGDNTPHPTAVAATTARPATAKTNSRRIFIG
jgi:hypothetical protein